MTETIKHSIHTHYDSRLDLEFNPETRSLRAGFVHGVGDPKVAHFSNIGDMDPIDFLVDMDWSYLKDEIFGRAARTPDFLGTVSSIKELIDNPFENNLDTKMVINLRASVTDVMTRYDGHDESSCLALIPAFQSAGFLDDTHHMIQFRPTDESMKFNAFVWEPILERLNEVSGLTSPFEVEEDEPEDETPEFG
jgi:hypothetical protein